MDEDRKKLLQGRRLAAARQMAGFRSARDAALSNSWPESTYRAHESGKRTIGQDDAERYAQRFRAAGAQGLTAQQILFGDGSEEAEQPSERQVIPIMGYVGAGAVVDPDFEQVPADGLEQVELPFMIPGDLIGLKVRGDSMLPRYDDGAVVIVHREPRRATSSLIGEEAAVLTAEGRRYLKRVMPGRKLHIYNLESVNARPIEGVRITWASEIVLIVPARQVRTIARKPGRRAESARPGRAGKPR